MADATALLEIGFLIAGSLDPSHVAAVREARERFLERMRRALPEFEWHVQLITRARLVPTPLMHPVGLLEAAATERDLRRWDFGFLFTDAELVSYDVPFSLGVPSRALGAAVISTAHLEPAEGGGSDRTLADRLERLVLHLFGHLNGLGHAKEGSPMCPARAAADLDPQEDWSPEELEELRTELRDVADLRLEELPGPRQPSLPFHLQVLWHNRGDLWSAIRQLAPWKFPLRFSRLTIAAVSTLIVLCVTAESWQLGMAQPLSRVIVLGSIALVASSAFVIRRQRLLMRRGRMRLTEQTAIANLSVLATMLIGMLTTYALLFLLVFAFARWVFPLEVVTGWAALEQPPGLQRFFVFSGFVATLGLAVGALGASFEEESYFRHVTYVDEET